jgi:SAM-dependent methyltransferase
MVMQCGVCGEQARQWSVVDGHEFSDCSRCDSIAMNAADLGLVDSGKFERQYDTNYWSEELSAAKERSWGPALARAAEAILLCRRPVERFLDIGTGPGFLLESLGHFLPSSKERFWGVEKFPPDPLPDLPGFIHGSLGELSDKYDAGVCVEVIEHLTPDMLRQLVEELSRVAQPNSLFIFNTGLANYVRHECASYIDPLRRGHIVSWGFPAINDIFRAEGFKVHRLGGREWAFAAEYLPDQDMPLSQRIWEPLEENRSLLEDPKVGMVMYLLARDSLRCEAL